MAEEEIVLEAPEFTLDELEQDAYSMDDFEVKDSVHINNRKSNMNAASQAALLQKDVEGVVESYRVVSSQLDVELESDAAKNIVDSVRKEAFADARNELVKFLADPQYSDEQKLAASEVVMNPESSLYDPNTILATEAVEAPEGRNETVEREVGRINMIDSLGEVQALKKAKQDILNRAVAGSTSDGVTATADFLQAVLPFVEGTMASKIQTSLDDEFTMEGLALLGSAKQDIIDKLRSAPVDQQLEFAQKIADVVSTNSSLVMKDQNDFTKVNFLRTFLEDGYYTDSDVWLDNIVSVLDMTVLGGPIASGVKSLRRLSRVQADDLSNATRDAARSEVAPSSTSQVFKETNTEKYRTSHEMISLDETGEAAEAMYGTSRADAISGDMMPEIGKTDGSVNNKVGNPDLNIVDEAFGNDGAIQYTKNEKTQLRADAVNDLKKVSGMSARKEMFSVDPVADGVKVRAIYGPTEGGWGSVDDSLDLAEWALRDYGVSKDQLTVLRRDGDEYVPSTVAEVKAIETVADQAGRPDFLVGFDYQYKFNPMDMGKWDELTVTNNLFNRIGAMDGTGKLAGFASGVQRYALDPQSMLDGHLTLAANVAVDKAAELEKKLLELGSGFGNNFLKLPKERQSVLDSIIKEQNHKGKRLTDTELNAQGISASEREVLNEWSNYWDTTYALENVDAVRSLQNKGFKEYVNKGADTQLFVKPLRKQDVEDLSVYDVTSGTIKTLTPDELEAIYSKGSSVAILKDPMNVSGRQARQMLVENTQEGGYLRGLTDNSQALHYREGYYTVNYTDPHFIIKKELVGGKEMTRAVATAGTIKDKELLLKRIQANDPEGEYFTRLDMKGTRQSMDDRWDVAMNSGRSTQRARGERLGSNHESGGLDPSQTPILNPVDSMIHSARSTANRVSMRGVLETSKQRFMNQFAEFLPTNDMGMRVFPSSIENVAYQGKNTQDSKRLADARATWEYIDYLEGGYANMIDDSYKSILNGMANFLGKYSEGAEKGLRDLSERRGPTAAGKNAAFNMYLASNPARQFIVQSHQAVQLAANFPKYVASGRAPLEVVLLTNLQMGLQPSKVLLKSLDMTASEAKTMFKQFKRSGLVASIDKQNLVRGALGDLADELSTKTGLVRDATKDVPVLNKVTHGSGKVTDMTLSGLRKIGFDAGENVNMMTAWLAQRYKAVDEGLDMADAEVADRVTGLARNYTYNMNAAGDMKYNQDSFAALFQFMQVPHKAVTQMLFNRNLSKAERAKLALFNSVMYTLPPAAMYEIVSDMGLELPEDELARNAIVHGLEGVFFNALLNQTFDGTATVDFSGLAPVDMYGTAEFIHGLFTTDIGKMVASTPSGQLFFGYNPRVTNLAKTAGRFFNLTDDYTETPTTFTMVANDFLKLSSGYSNFMKASYAMEAGKTANGLDLNVSESEALMASLGFPTATETMSRWVADKTYRESKALKDDVAQWYGDYKKQLFRDGLTPSESDHVIRMYNEAWRVWKGPTEEVARKHLDRMIKKDVESKDLRLYKTVMNVSGHTDNAEFKMLIDNLPESMNYTKEQLNSTYEFLLEYK